MDNWQGCPEFATWAGQACRLIRFAPDRERVREELIAHMEDARDAYAQSGVDSRQAIARVLEHMGDADTVARQMQQLYRPFWGYVWRWTRVLGTIAALYLVWNLVVVPVFGLVGILLDGETPWYSQDDVADYVRSHNKNSTIISDFTPQDSAKVDGYGISIARICFREAADGYRSAYFVLRVTNVNPWLQSPMFFRNLYALDDRGNLYPPRDYTATSMREVCGNGPYGNVFVSYYELWISDVDPEATSFTLGFDDYGVSWDLSFPVEGGIEYAQD